MQKSGQLVLACLGLLISSPGWPIVIRHDSSDNAHVQLAKKYPQPVVLSRTSLGSADGMGTWIAENWILTAAHVAEGIRRGDLIADGIAVIDVVLHPSWPNEPVDVGLIRVADGARDADVVAVCEPDNHLGKKAVFLGAGDNGNGVTGPNTANGQMRGAENVVTLAGKTFLAFDFDAPNSPVSLTLEGVSGPGDSGGPAYLETGTGVCIVAVSSGQDTEPTGGAEGRYNVVEYYSRADIHADWISNTMSTAK